MFIYVCINAGWGRQATTYYSSSVPQFPVGRGRLVIEIRRGTLRSSAWLPLSRFSVSYMRLTGVASKPLHSDIKQLLSSTQGSQCSYI